MNKIDYEIATDFMNWTLTDCDTGEPMEGSPEELARLASNDGYFWKEWSDEYAHEWSPSTNYGHAMTVLDKLVDSGVAGPIEYDTDQRLWIIDCNYGTYKGKNLLLVICMAATKYQGGYAE